MAARPDGAATGARLTVGFTGMQTFLPDDLKFTYSAEHTPIGTVESGETFVVETEDCFTARFRHPDGFTPENLAWVLENLDGVTGPIAVAGAERGGAVAVTLHRVEVTTPGSIAWSTCEADSPAAWWSEWYACDGLEIRDGYVHVGELRIAARPLVGCIATAPDRETVFSKMQGPYGGNMDCNEVREGATVVLPVEVDGAYLYFGDSKARMGDGEVVQNGDSQELVLKPSDDYISNFTKNINRGRVIRVGSIMEPTQPRVSEPGGKDCSIPSEMLIEEALPVVVASPNDKAAVVDVKGKTVGAISVGRMVHALAGDRLTGAA